ncbi:MAG TPA: beta-galactosidase GalA [Rhizomicrobium sp.]|nr:beta-galactosidase GalA [Rhizomicrobium sp.]
MTEITRRKLLQASALSTAASVVDGAAAANTSLAIPKPSMTETVRERLLLDFGWKFHLGHADDPARDFGFGRDQQTFAKAGRNVADAAMLDFDDHAWETLDLPHDWVVALPFVPSANPPASPTDDPRAAHGFKPLGRAYPETSIGWYRRRVAIPASDLGRKLTLEFDGVFRDAVVMLNGYIIARNEGGYVPFAADISDFLNYGGENVLAVRVDATLGEGWFYEGAGIYRHVWLVKSDPLHIPRWSVCTRSRVVRDTADITILTDVANYSNIPKTCILRWTVFDVQDRAIASVYSSQIALAQGEVRSLSQSIYLTSPWLWSLERPYLYQLKVDVIANNRVSDDAVVPFGIRSIHFDSEKGLFLNGKNVKLKGTCNHQDHAGVGSALPDRLQEFRIEKLKAMGSNAYRCAHNPPAPELLDACDRLGMLVIDETRRMSSDAQSMDALSRMVLRDRNHPSIMLWSIGNEEQSQQGSSRGARIAADMKKRVQTLDPTRPITAAVDDSKTWGIGITPVLDVLGCNYRTDQIPAFHSRMPQKPVIGTETGSTVSTRGVYVRDPSSGYEVAYDTEFPWWASTAESWWKVVAPAPYIAGGFVWTGFDYRGEPTPQNRWPNVSSQFGIMDMCGFPKDNYFYYRAWWQDEAVLHLFPHWNWSGGQTVNVWCHTNLDQIELFVNGREIGARDVARFSHLEWNVPFEPGILEARGYRAGVMVLSEKRETTGEPAQIQLSADRTSIDADGEDVAVITVQIADAQGRAHPTAGNLVFFALSGPGRIIGVANGDPRSHEPDTALRRAAFNGLCMVLVQATKTAGDITLRATAPGLAPATLTWTAAPARPRPFVA